ncbi:glycosyl hydrolase family 61-domain-containing protein [Mycena metata]|uniref:lytic cellulose monooxygenase (C4-dehydrogenating) n=1 Tax=Mycena metata TaxID=1033252 RepID=A0AAD7JBZ7_9AGAR|nr:glycosyl hydrolase family 61-domain-containing protein [Mycena metata]
MKFLSGLVAVAILAAKVSAHYTWPDLILPGGVITSDWEYVRQTNNWEDLNPVTDVTTDDIRCYTSNETDTSSTVTVTAGSTIGLNVPITLYHPGVANIYMAKAPAGTDVADWDGSGTVWFKASTLIYEIPAVANGETITFPSQNLAQVTFTIPADTPSGQYLIRAEHIALHVAQVYGGAQFYIACAQVEVTGGGTGDPGPLVAFPGAYTFLSVHYSINIYYPISTNYTQPGPPVWTGGVSSLLFFLTLLTLTQTVVTPPPVSSTGTTTKASTTTSTKASTTTSSKASTTTTSSTTTSSTTTSSGTTAPEYGQCGGLGWTGDTSFFV